MGVMSRRVVPVCGNLCFFCPSMRARSRQPVKRYKKLLSDIFPRSQDAEPNDRKIGKLCEYASKNPLRIPKLVLGPIGEGDSLRAEILAALEGIQRAREINISRLILEGDSKVVVSWLKKEDSGLWSYNNEKKKFLLAV